MKKYFMKGVDEPIEFGDTLGFDLVKKDGNGHDVTKHVECDFCPEVVDLLLEAEIIEEKEIKEDSKPSVEGIINNFKEYDEEPEEETDEEEPTVEDVIDAMIEAQEETEKTIKVLAAEIKKLNRRVNSLERSKKPEKLFEDEYVTMDDYLKRHKNIFKSENTTYSGSILGTPTITCGIIF